MLTSAVQARAGSPFCGVLDALGPPCLTANVRDMTLSATLGSLKNLRKVSWRFQQTFLTPLQNLQPFVATIISGREQIQGATVTIDSVVFEPKHLHALLASQRLPLSLQRQSYV